MTIFLKILLNIFGKMLCWWWWRVWGCWGVARRCAGYLNRTGRRVGGIEAPPSQFEVGHVGGEWGAPRRRVSPPAVSRTTSRATASARPLSYFLRRILRDHWRWHGGQGTWEKDATLFFRWRSTAPQPPPLRKTQDKKHTGDTFTLQYCASSFTGQHQHQNFYSEILK